VRERGLARLNSEKIRLRCSTTAGRGSAGEGKELARLNSKKKGKKLNNSCRRICREAKGTRKTKF
jgi:hypothetical protein